MSDTVQVKPKKNQWVLKLLVAIAAFLIIYGVWQRISIIRNSDPIGVGGDIAMLKQAWEDICGNPAQELSNRLSQYWLVFMLGGLQKTITSDFAHGAEVLSLIFGSGVIFAVFLFILSMGINRYTALAGATVLALAPEVLRQTIPAASESPFLFFLLMAMAFILFYWRNGKRKFLIAGSLLFWVACGIRGTGMLHLFVNAALLSVIWILEKENREANKGRMIGIWISAMAVFSVFSVGKIVVTKIAVSAYEQKYSKTPIIPDYTAYVVHDGITAKPFGADDKMAWQKRQEIYKKVDPLTLARSPQPSLSGKSTVQIILENKKQYFKNYLSAIRITFRRYWERNSYNLCGIWPVILGLLLLFRRKKYLPLITLTGWILLYLFIIPAVHAHSRTIWPAAVAFGILGGYFFTELSRYGARSKNPLMAFSIFFVMLILLFLSVKQLRAASRQLNGYKDYRLEAREQVKPVANSAPRLMATESGIAAYGNTIRYIQIPFNRNTSVQRRYILKNRPDYIMLHDQYMSRWKEVLSHLSEALKKPKGFRAKKVWKKDGIELWKIDY